MSERLSGENETGELFSAQMKGKRKPLLIVSLPHCQVWVEIRTLTTLTLPSTQTIHAQKLLNTKYQDHNSRLCLEGKPLRNLRLRERRDSWEVESIRAACEGLYLLFGFWSDNRTEIDQRTGHRESLNSSQRDRSVKTRQLVTLLCWLAKWLPMT